MVYGAHLFKQDHGGYHTYTAFAALYSIIRNGVVDEIAELKTEMRREALRQRVAMRADADDLDAFCEMFFGTVEVTSKTVLAAYWPKAEEFNTGHIIEEVLRRSAVLALPVVEKDTKILKFVRWDGTATLVAGAFGVMQPENVGESEGLEPDVVVVPLLAFDRRGYRLGYGGGYYDATLSMLRGKREILAVGVGYAQQACLFNLPIDAHDQRLDMVVTPQQVLRFT